MHYMQPPIILDIEASGFGAGSYPVEIGYVDANGETWCALVQPQAEWLHWDDSAEQLHHQSRQDLLAYGQSVTAIATHLNRMFAGKTLYCDGWYQDFVWLHSLFEAADMTPAFKLEDLRFQLSDAQKAVWHETKQTVIQDLAARTHNAATDAKVLQLTWLQTAHLPNLQQAFSARLSGQYI
jgi:hypothetical protein